MADSRKKKNYSNQKNDKKDKSPAKKRSFGYKLIPYILVAIALVMVLCLITTLIFVLGDSGDLDDHVLGPFGYYFSTVFLGVFGYSAFAIPVLLTMFLIFWEKYNKESLVAINAITASVSAIIVSALIHIFVNMADGKQAFTYDVVALYEDGAALRGGGVLGGLVSFALVHFANVVGAIILLILILIPMIFFLAGTTPVDAAKVIAAKIKKANEERKEQLAKDRAYEREQEKLDKEAEREQDKLDREAEREAKRQEREEEREAARIAREEEKAAKAAEREAAREAAREKASENDVATKNKNAVLKINAFGDTDDDGIDDDESDNVALKTAIFTNAEIGKMDGIKDTDRPYVDDEDDDDYEDDNDDVLNTVVFYGDDGKGAEKQKYGFERVDQLVSERFDENGMVIDEETGEVFTPAVQDRKARSANEFRAQNEQNEERFIGEKPEPVPIPEYKFPSVDLLEKGTSRYSSDPAEVEANAARLRDVLTDFRIPIKEITCSCGPTITRYEIKPEAGVRVRQIANLVDDIGMALAKSGIRIEAPIPGKAAVGVEVPNDKPAAVKLRNLIETPDFTDHKSKLAACLGADVSGNPVIFDIEKMPHLLVAGTTGSGKSVCINSIIMSILYHAKPDEVKLLLVDPKQVEFQVYKDLPHLCCRVISNPKKAAGALNLAVNEMEKRFELIKEVGVRNITGYNEATKNDPDKPYMPRMVIIIDEFADLMMTARDEVETAVVRIAQKARAAGIHLIIGTQRPSVDVITGLIKANIPSRIAFTVMSGVDSRTILDTVGAEKLCGRGDMLYAPVGAQKPQRVQGTFVSDGEVETVVEWVKANNAPVIYDNEFESQLDIEAAKCGNQQEKSGGAGEFSGGAGGDEESKLYDAAMLAIDAGKISTSLLQRRLSIGYGRAAKIIDTLEEMGVVGPADGNKPRKILMTKEDFAELMNNQ
ncbi:MAG: DNA translocase FtsK 4TM domain-containing protein [Clostridia bacterium]|nr:DNA translocase FtsK 4TM domain-containing protein [Clostridia bacterium]